MIVSSSVCISSTFLMSFEEENFNSLTTGRAFDNRHKLEDLLQVKYVPGLDCFALCIHFHIRVCPFFITGSWLVSLGRYVYSFLSSYNMQVVYQSINKRIRRMSYLLVCVRKTLGKVIVKDFFLFLARKTKTPMSEIEMIGDVSDMLRINRENVDDVYGVNISNQDFPLSLFYKVFMIHSKTIQYNNLKGSST